ncbi:MAG: LamG domain-containing protein, partial [Planctomycetes bacterium]|nr:LamG domain-containing protein [Planctomycetota bacterium]
IYVDGQLDNSKGSSGVIITNDNSLYVGADAVWPDYEYSGSIDDVRIYNRALSATEITELSDVIFAVAHFPVPADEAEYVQLDSDLSFVAGSYATSHDIYLGTDYDEVADANISSDTFEGNQGGLTFDPGILEVETMYYWRVDEIDGANVVTGNLWSFTTTDIEPDPTLVGRWNFDEGMDYTAYDSSGNGHDGELWGDPRWEVVERMGMHLYIGYNANRVEISDESAFDITDEITIATWIRNNGFKYWGDNDAIVHKGTDAWYLRRNGGWGAADSLRFSLEDVGAITTSDAVTIANDEWHHIAATYNGSEMCLYVDGQLNNSVSASGQIATNSDPVWIGNNPDGAGDALEGARLKDLRIYDRGLSASEIAEIATPPYTSNPNPEHKSTVASANVQLSFKAGKGAASHNVYFGDDHLAVNKATEASDVFQANVAGNTFSPPTLEVRKTYYWRVDAVKGSKVAKGNVWRFYVPCEGGDLEADANGDCVVDLKDYAAVAKDFSVSETSVATASLECSTLGSSDGIKMSLSSVLVDLSTDPQGYAQFYSYDGQSLSEPGQPQLQWRVIMAL